MTQDSIMSAERFHELIADEAKRELRDMRVIGQLKLPYLIPLLKARDEAIRNAALEEAIKYIEENGWTEGLKKLKYHIKFNMKTTGGKTDPPKPYEDPQGAME